MNDIPLVSVLIPSYNHSEYIEEAIQSVWAQTYPNIELIVIDDGSTDNSPTLISSLCSASPIKMTFISKHNEGICNTLNQAIQLSSGKYISILASDDRYLPRKLEYLIPLLESADSSVAFVYSLNTVISTDTLVQNVPTEPVSELITHLNLEGDLFDDILLFKSTPTICSMVFRKQILLDIGLFNENYRFEDYDLLLRLTRLYKSIFAEVPTFEYRGHVHGSLGKSISLLYPDLIEIFNRNICHASLNHKPTLRKRACASLFTRISESFYMNLQMRDSFKWSLRSIRQSPIQYKAYRLLLGSLLGSQLISILRRIRPISNTILTKLNDTLASIYRT